MKLVSAETRLLSFERRKSDLREAFAVFDCHNTGILRVFQLSGYITSKRRRIDVDVSHFDVMCPLGRQRNVAIG